LSSARHRRRRPTPTRISTPPRRSEASTIWSTIYANRSHQISSHLAAQLAWGKVGAERRLPLTRVRRRISRRIEETLRGLQTKAGEVRLRVPKLRRQTFDTAIIERYRRRESSVEEALIEMYQMYLAGV
jgi:Transposase, Mutator family